MSLKSPALRVDVDGIPMNDFFDPANGESYNFPDDGRLIHSEPIWMTAKRQGFRVIVIDWPMSHDQLGEFKSDFFEQRFDQRQTDAQRLAMSRDLLNSDHATPPLRLVLTYASHVDSTGHRYGPDSPQIEQAVKDVDVTSARSCRLSPNGLTRRILPMTSCTFCSRLIMACSRCM